MNVRRCVMCKSENLGWVYDSGAMYARKECGDCGSTGPFELVPGTEAVPARSGGSAGEERADA